MHYYYNSHLGQPLKLFDKAGKITWAARSQAFGQTTVFVNETGNNLRFPGQYEDGETGLFHNYHRYYDKQPGRYLRRDPMGLSAGSNSYLYAYTDPVLFVDPMGLIGCTTAAVVGGIVGGLVGGALNGALAGALGGTAFAPGPGSVAGAVFGARAGALGGAIGGALLHR